jgi:ATP-dependent exoDNAse (exonuclease V) beta subunit
MDNWFLLDRHRGLTLKVPDGRGKLVAGCTFNRFEQRHAWREQFESMRLLYVAATRAQDRLILSGTTKELEGLTGKGDTWLKWIWQSLGLETQTHSSVIDLADDVQIQLSVNLADQPEQPILAEAPAAEQSSETADSLAEAFPLLRPIEPERAAGLHRFSVTQLINYRRCPRQYYFDRVLRLPSSEEMAVWNDAEAPEPPANLTATLKGAVIHRFCETFCAGDDPLARLRQSFQDLIRLRKAQLADRLPDIDEEKAVTELLPLAQNYLASSVFRRVEAARRLSDANPCEVASAGTQSANPKSEVRNPKSAPGLWSELGFRIRRPLGILTGAIDKLLITPSRDGGCDVEIIDFKTNRLPGPRTFRQQSAKGASAMPPVVSTVQQIAFDFAEPAPQERAEDDTQSIDEAVRRLASDYQLQMQAYALAVRELLPAPLNDHNQIRVTLHFLDPNVEYSLPEELLVPAICARAIDDAMIEIVSSREPADFPVHPALHCRMCNFRELCSDGREWLRHNKAWLSERAVG